MRTRLTLLLASCATALALSAAPALASTYTITISTSPTTGGSWSGGTFTPTADATLDVTDLEAQLANGNVTVGGAGTTSLISISGAVSSTPANTLTFAAPVDLTGDTTLDIPGGSVFTATVDGGHSLTIAGNATFEEPAGSATKLSSLSVTSGTATFAASSGTEGAGTTGTQSYASTVTVDGSGSASFATTDAQVTFGGALQAPGGAGVTVSTGTGMINFDGAVGGSGEDPGSLTAMGPATIDTGSIEDTTAQAYMDAVTLAHDTTLTSTAANGEVEFYGTVDGAHALSVDDDNITQLNGAVGGGTALQSLTVGGSGTTQIAGGSVTSTGSQDYQGPVTLQSTSTLSSTGSGDLTFGSTLDGGYPLALATAGTTTFDGSVGGVAPLTSLTIGDGGSVTIDSAEVVTSQGQAYGAGTLTVGAPLPAAPPTLQGGQITSSGTLVYDRDLTIDGAGDLSGPGSGSSCCSLTKQGSGTLTLAGGGSAPDAVFVENGTLDVTGSVPGPVTESAGTTANVSGTVDGQVTVPASATLNCDDGTINGAVTGGGTTTGAPTAPTGVSATGALLAAAVAFTPGTAGCNPVHYTVASSPAGAQGSGSSSPITVLPLSYWTPYTFTVTATNPIGSATSAPSSALTLQSGPPLALISSPASGQTYTVGQPVATSFSCLDIGGGTGLASCVDSNGASSPSGRLDTSRPGTFTYTVIATSKDALTGSASITYTVEAPPPGNSFTTSAIRSAGHGVVTFKLTLPGAGRAAIAETAGHRTLAHLHRRVRARGTLHVTLKISARERGLLRHARRLTVRISVTYTPTGGTPRTVRLRAIALELG